MDGRTDGHCTITRSPSQATLSTRDARAAARGWLPAPLPELCFSRDSGQRIQGIAPRLPSGWTLGKRSQISAARCQRSRYGWLGRKDLMPPLQRGIARCHHPSCEKSSPLWAGLERGWHRVLGTAYLPQDPPLQMQHAKLFFSLPLHLINPGLNQHILNV